MKLILKEIKNTFTCHLELCFLNNFKLEFLILVHCATGASKCSQKAVRTVEVNRG